MFCFPYAGGGATIYRAWPKELSMVDVFMVQLPGRETRLKEVPFTSLTLLVQALAQALLPFLDKPFVFFGHSMGALIAFQLVRELRRQYGVYPSHLFVSGQRDPKIPLTHPRTHDLPEEEFIERLRSLNGTPAAVLEHVELIRMLLPTLRADLAICETYVYKPEEPLSSGISVFGGLQDTYVERTHLETWRGHTTGEFRLTMLPGDHFFLHTSQKLLLEILSRELNRILKRIE